MPRTINQNLGDSGIPITHGPTPPGGPDMRDAARLNRGGEPRTDNRDLTQRLDMVLRIGFSACPRREEYPPESPLRRAVKMNDVLLVQLREFSLKAREIMDSGQYTPIGLANRLKSIGGDYLLRVKEQVEADTMRPTVVRLRDRAEEAIAAALKEPGSEPVPFAEEAEARAHLYAMTPSERLAAWKIIIDTRDEVGIQAVLHALKWKPVLPESVVQEGVKMLVEAANPDAVKKRDDANEALAAIDAMYADAKAMIAGICNIDIRPRREGLSAADREGVVS